jgi:hypothetical protein
VPQVALSGSARPKSSIVDAGIDWLSATVAPGPKSADFFSLWNDIARAQYHAGNDLKVWHWNGYEGHTAGHAAYGTRHDGAYLRLSAGASAVWWRDAFAIAGRAARLDVQVTIDGIRAGRDLAREAKLQANVAPPRRGRPVDWQYTQTRAKGATTYIGSRTSQQFVRLYDKGAEAKIGHLTGLWRYEVETKDERAGAVARALLAQPAGEKMATSFVHHTFSRQGVRPAFARPVDAPAVAWQRDETDDERRLKWLREHVAKTVNRLISNGLEVEVRQALGLSHEKT